MKAHKAFGRKYVSQLQAIRQATLLLSLSEDGVNLFTIPQLKLTCQASRTRYASRFAWSEDKAMLCVAVKRKIIQFHYDGREFVELKEYSASDTPQALHWCGDAICVGLKNRWVHLLVLASCYTSCSVRALGRQPIRADELLSCIYMLQLSAHAVKLRSDERGGTNWQSHTSVYH